jgi:hypothetical protein
LQPIFDAEGWVERRLANDASPLLTRGKIRTITGKYHATVRPYQHKPELTVTREKGLYPVEPPPEADLSFLFLPAPNAFGWLGAPRFA